MDHFAVSSTCLFPSLKFIYAQMPLNHYTRNRHTPLPLTATPSPHSAHASTITGVCFCVSFYTFWYRDLRLPFIQSWIGSFFSLFHLMLFKSNLPLAIFKMFFLSLSLLCPENQYSPIVHFSFLCTLSVRFRFFSVWSTIIPIHVTIWLAWSSPLLP